MKPYRKLSILLVLLAIIGPLLWYIGTAYYICYQKRTFVEIEGFDTITIWRNYIIFERYWYPIYPKKNFIEIQSTWDNYFVYLATTQDSTLRFGCNYPIVVKKLDNIKFVELLKLEEYVDWEKLFNHTEDAEFKEGRHQIEMYFQMWYPCYPHNGVYLYRRNNEASVGFFGEQSIK